MEPLALKYRPRTFEDLVGQPAVQVILRQMVKTSRVPSALLFSGCRGTGKTTTARILAAALNCTETDKPCGICPSCKDVFDGSSLDYIEIDAASNGLVDDIRALRQSVLYEQVGRWRIIALDEAQSISPAGFNALLKTLEEPPPNTTFILLTTEPNKILSTVASRCIPFRFNRLSIAAISDRLTHVAQVEGKIAEPDLFQLLAERADGAMRDALMLLDQVTRVGLTTADQYRRLLGHTDHAPAILDRLAHGDLASAFAQAEEAFTQMADPAALAAEIVAALRDVLVLRCGGELHSSGVALAQRQNLALLLDNTAVVNALKICWQLKTLPQFDARADVELALVMLSEVLKTDTEPGRMNLTDMGRFS